MKKILLTPYPGYVMLVRDVAELHRRYKKLTGFEYPHKEHAINGSSTKLESKTDGIVYLVYAARGLNSTLAHEFAHVCLQVFDWIGADPKGGSGEPFAYLLGHLMEEAAKK